MKLWMKVILLLAVVLIPLVGAFTFYQLKVEGRRVRMRQAERLVERVKARPNTACAPRQRRGPPRALAYSSTFEPLLPNHPRLSAGLTSTLSALDSPQRPVDEPLHWTEPIGPNPRRTLGASVLYLNDSPECTWVIIPWYVRPDASSRGLARAVVFSQALFMAFAILITGLIISVPLVRRINRLTKHVDTSSTSSWSIPDSMMRGSDEIASLARAFHDASGRIDATIQALDERDRTLKEYIANTTHDLAIPLTVLQHRLTKLQSRLSQRLPVDPDIVDTAIEESHYIAGLIANMSAAAKLESADSSHPEHDVDLCRLIERVIQRHRPIALQKHIELEWSVIVPEADDDPIEPHVSIRAEPVLLEQALSNLVQNAVQYTDHHGHIAVILHVVSTAPPSPVFSVRVLDDGPGVPEHLLTQLGQRSMRGDRARNRNPGGQGFGLAIVSRVCDIHGWGLLFENLSPQGFQVTIQSADS